jgi:hypothetical protein
MTTNKNIEFKFTVDQASVQKAKQALTDLISLADRLGKALSGAGGGARHGNSPPMSFLSGIGATGSKAAGVGGGPGGNPGAGISAAITAQARGIKDLSKISSDSLRNMAGELRKSVDDQKRALKDLDAALETAGKRYQDLKSRQSQLVSSMMAQGASPTQARAYANNQLEAQEDYVNNLKHRRVGARGQYEDAVKSSRDYYDKVDPYKAGAAELSPWQNAKNMMSNFGLQTRLPNGNFMRAGAMGALGLGAVVAGANEMQTQRFDIISNEARQAQAWKNVGVGTKNGDLTAAAAMLQVLRDPDKAKEFLGVGNATGEARAQGIAGAVTGIFSNPNVPGQMLRSWNEADTVQKEKLRSYMDQQIQADPEYFDKLSKFQSEAGMRVHAMRRLGMGSDSLSKVRQGFGEDIGGEVSAFDAVRGGGFRFAQRNMWSALSAQRAGLNTGDIGQAIAAQAPSGDINQLMKTLRVTLDPVASEHLAKGIAAGINSSVYGVVSGLGLGETLRFGTEGMSGEMQARTMGRRASSLGAIGSVMGGADGMGKGINVLSANQIVGPGGDLFTVNALANVMKDPTAVAAAARGEVSPALQAMGISADMINQMVSKTTSWNVRARTIGQGGAELSPAMESMRNLKENFGGDVKKMVGSMAPGALRDRMVTNLAAGYQATMPDSFSTFDQAEAFVSYQAGLGGPRAKGGNGSGDAAFKSAELEYARKTAADNEENQRKFMAAEKDNLKDLTALTQVYGKTFISMGSLDKSAGDAAQSIKALKDAVDGLTTKLGGEAPKSRAKSVEKVAQELGAKAAHDKLVADKEAAGGDNRYADPNYEWMP